MAFEKSFDMYPGDGVKWSFDGKRYLLVAHADFGATDPRDDDDLTVMACFHRRYTLGDKIDADTPEEFWRGLVRDSVPAADIFKAALDGALDGIRLAKLDDGDNCYDIYETCYLAGYQMRKEARECLEYSGISKSLVADYILDDLTIGHCQALLKDCYAWLALWLYDHSGLAMAATNGGNPFWNRWDSGQVGWILVKKEDAIRKFGASAETWRAAALDFMKGAAAEYDDYISGRVFGYVLYDLDDRHGAVNEDSCWGFYGSDILKSGMADAVGRGLIDAIKAGNYEVVADAELAV